MLAFWLVMPVSTSKSPVQGDYCNRLHIELHESTGVSVVRLLKIMKNQLSMIFNYDVEILYQMVQTF